VSTLALDRARREEERKEKTSGQPSFDRLVTWDVVTAVELVLVLDPRNNISSMI
jgi:hypothetical protein